MTDKNLNLYYVNHSPNEYAEIKYVPTNVLVDRIREGYVLPIVLRPDASDSTLYSAVYRGVKFVCHANKVSVLVGNQFMDDNVLPFNTILKNTFINEVRELTLMLGKYPESSLELAVLDYLKECDNIVQ